MNVTDSPTYRAAPTGCVVIAGASPLTLSVVAGPVADPHALVATQSYTPASPGEADGIVYVAPVAPPIAFPPLRHWSVGVGDPETAATSTTSARLHAERDAGPPANVGGVFTVNAAGVLVALPHMLLTTQSYDPVSSPTGDEIV